MKNNKENEQNEGHFMVLSHAKRKAYDNRGLTVRLQDFLFTTTRRRITDRSNILVVQDHSCMK